ncbi:hypothetical protein SNEBB_003780 [Seison nebaliae]|nr:hypothetical protein SNEBB_003780 [Seison nebaliae]
MEKDTKMDTDENGLLGIRNAQGEHKIIGPTNAIPMILQKYHDNIGGHFGKSRTEELIKSEYYWPTIKQEVSEWIETE